MTGLPPRDLTERAGPVQDCARCGHWQPGPVVLRGNTVGWCALYGATVPADHSCPTWQDAETRGSRT